MSPRALLAAVACLAALPAVAASFDCRKAKAEDEKAICADAALSKLDEDMAASYKATLALMSGDKPREAAFRRNQSQWIRERARCGDTITCLRDELVSRIRWLASPAQQYAGEWASQTALLIFHVQRSGDLYVALWPDKTKSPEHQDMVFMTIAGKFMGARQMTTGEDTILVANPQFSRANAGLKASCPELRLSFGKADMMGIEGGDKCKLPKAGDGDFRPRKPLFFYESMR